jgi:hypothetical protein
METNERQIMSTPHKATERQWGIVRRRAKNDFPDSTDSGLLELAHRVAALEAVLTSHGEQISGLHLQHNPVVDNITDLQGCVNQLEAATSPPPAADHFRGATEMVATDEDLRKYWNKMRNSGSMFDDALRAVYNLGRQHSAQSRQEAAATQPPAPHGYAYRYPGIMGGIKFTHGQEINGSRPIEAIPYWLGKPPVDLLKEVEPTPPPAPAGGLLYEVARLLANRISLMRPSADCTPLARDVLAVVADWMDARGDRASAAVLRRETDR